jgi:hypothetical protein
MLESPWIGVPIVFTVTYCICNLHSAWLMVVAEKLVVSKMSQAWSFVKGCGFQQHHKQLFQQVLPHSYQTLISGFGCGHHRGNSQLLASWAEASQPQLMSACVQHVFRGKMCTAWETGSKSATINISPGPLQGRQDSDELLNIKEAPEGVWQPEQPRRHIVPLPKLS